MELWDYPNVWECHEPYYFWNANDSRTILLLASRQTGRPSPTRKLRTYSYPGPPGYGVCQGDSEPQRLRAARTPRRRATQRAGPLLQTSKCRLAYSDDVLLSRAKAPTRQSVPAPHRNRAAASSHPRSQLPGTHAHGGLYWGLAYNGLERSAYWGVPEGRSPGPHENDDRPG